MRKRSFVLGAQDSAVVLQELAEVGPQLDDGGGFPAAGGARFQQHAVGDFAGSAEALRVGETVTAPESADGLALAGDETSAPGAQPTASRSFFSSRSMALLPKGGLEGEWIKEDVDVFRKPLDQVPAFRQAGAAFEDDFVAGGGGDDPQGFGDVVVLLDDGRAQSLRRENAPPPGVIACSKSGCSNSFTSAALLRLPSPGVRQPGQQPKVEAGKRIQGSPQALKVRRGLSELLTQWRRASRALAAARSQRP